MPRINGLPIETKRPFKKKAYRPWNLMDEDVSHTQTNEVSTDPLTPEPDKVTIKETISNHQVNNKETIGNQKVNIKETIGNQKVSIKEPSSNRYSNQYGNQLVNNSSEILAGETPHSNVLMDAYDLILRLSSLQRKILFFVVEDCILNASLFTSPISLKSLAKQVNTDSDTMKTTTQRMINNKIISRKTGKRGRGGFVIFGITEEIRDVVIDSQKRCIKSNQLVNDKVTNIVTIKETTSPYSSSNIYINNTTTALPEDWKKINHSLLESIGFTEQHLFDIYSTKICDPAVVQESIFHFAFALEEGRNQYDNPLNVFVGRLRKGKAWIESHYESPKDKALRELVNRKKMEKEKRDVLISEMVDLEFPEWRKNLDESEIQKIVPADILKLNLSPAIAGTLRNWFIENVLLPRLDDMDIHHE